MKKRIILITGFLFLGLMIGFSQETRNSGEKTSSSKSPAEIKGTYQIEFLKADKIDPIAVTRELASQIEAARDENKFTYVNVSSVCRIKVFPRKQLETLSKQEEYVIVDNFSDNK